MKKTSTKKHLKRTVILASLIFGSLLLTACGGPFVNSGNTDNTAQGSGDGNGNQQISNFLEEFKNLSENEQNHLISSINNDINVLKSNNIKLEYTDGKFSLSLPDKLTYSVTPIIEENADSSEALGINLIETYKKKNNEEKAKRETLSKDNIKTSIDGYSVPSNLKNKITKVDDLKTDIKNLVDNNDTSKITLEASYGDADLSKLYLKMSDLDSSILPEATEDGATVIPGVKRIMKNDRTALDFTGDASQKVLVDCSPNAVEDGDSGKVYYTDFSKYYRGGILYKDADISLTNDTGIFVYKSNKGDFSAEDSRFSVLDVFKAKDASFSKLTLQSSDKNLYGVIDEELYQKYYDRISLAGEYDAKEALGEETMFNDTPVGYNTNAHTIKTRFAEYLLSKGVSIKNVIIGGNDDFNPSENGYDGTLINSVVNVNMNNVGALYVKGLVRFNGKSPKSLFAKGTASYSKVIFDSESAWNDNLLLSQDYAPVLDVSKLGSKQDSIYEKIPRGYYSGDKSFTRSLQASMMFGTKYYKSTNNDYSDASRERYGNTNVDPNDDTDLIPRTKLKDGDQVPTTARANNIKLTPVQKLLLDDQHIYG